MDVTLAIVDWVQVVNALGAEQNPPARTVAEKASEREHGILWDRLAAAVRGIGVAKELVAELSDKDRDHLLWAVQEWAWPTRALTQKWRIIAAIEGQEGDG